MGARKREETKPRAPKSSRRSALSVTPLRQEVHTSRDRTSTDFSDGSLARPIITRIRPPTRRAVSLGTIPPYLNTLKTRRSTLRAQRWFLPESRNRPRERTLSHISRAQLRKWGDC